MKKYFKKHLPSLLCGLVLVLNVKAFAEETSPVGSITITNTVILEDTKNFGVNVSKDSYNAPMLKERLNMNFEGTLFQHIFIVAEDNNDKSGVLVGKTKNDSPWFKDSKKSKALIHHPDAEFWAVSGPNRWEPLKLVSCEERKAMMWGGKKEGLFLKFDKEISVPPWGGVAFRLLDLSRGQLQEAGSGASHFKGCKISHDVPAESTGQSSCLLNGKASHMTNIAYSNCSDTKGLWKLDFWAKGLEGGSALIVKFATVENQIEVTNEWKKYTIEHEVTEDLVIGVKFVSEKDKILIDDVLAFKTGDKNPTSFNDDFFDIINDLGTGMPLRSGDVCEGRIDNMVGPRKDFYKHAWSPKMKPGPENRHNTYFLPLHQLYDFCAKTGNEPWYIVPGIMTKKEMAQFIEYLGAPADVGLGKVRAAQGQIQPWTEVLSEMHIEIGNETWNLMFWGANCNGPDYWSDLIETAHSSPYWKDNISIILNERSHAPEFAPVTKIHTKADAYSMAPYVIHKIGREHTEALDTDEKIFRWAFAEGVNFSLKHNKAAKAAWKNNAEYKVYEINHHLMYNYSPVDFCQVFQNSVGGGINIANAMLINLKFNKARTQCLFKLIGGGIDKEIDTGIWGTVFSMSKKNRMYHPLFLALQVTNKALGGDLLETKNTGIDPIKSLIEDEIPVVVAITGKDSDFKVESDEFDNAVKYLARRTKNFEMKNKKDALAVAKAYVKKLRFNAPEITVAHRGILFDVLKGLSAKMARKANAIPAESRNVENVLKAIDIIKKSKIKKTHFKEVDMDAIWSYAFKKDKKNSIILINIDPEKERKVKLNFTGNVKGNTAKKHLLTSEKITDANWLADGKSKVKIAESEIADFKSGIKITIPPFSLQTIIWEE